MSQRDYAAEDAALDLEIQALYAPESESEEAETTPEAPETGTASEEQTPESTEHPSDENEGTVSQDEPEQIAVPEAKTVPEERYQNAVKAMNKAMLEAANLRKQDSARDNLIQQLQAQVQQLQERPTAPKETESTQPEMDDDDLEEAISLYPEVANPLLKRIAALEKQLSKVNSDVGDVKSVADRYQKNEQKTAEEKHWDFISGKHPDVDEIVQQPEYAEWYAQQGPMIQNALQKGTAKDVVAALNLYRAEYPKTVAEVPAETVSTKPAANKSDKLAEAKAAASPTIKSSVKPEKKPTFTNSQIEKMSRQEFMKHEAAIDEALARGEIY